MKFFKAILKKLKEPTAAVATVAAILLILSAGGVFACIFLSAPHAVAYVLYGVSALFLCYFIYVAVCGWFKTRPRFYEWAEKHRLARRFIGDLTFRTMIFAALGMLINVGYAAFNAVYGVIIAVNYGIIATSIWYCAVAVYYIILSVTRAVIIARTRNVNVNVTLTLQQQNMQKIKIYRATGWLLLILTAALITILWTMVQYPSMGFHFEGLLIFVAAAFTCYKIVFAAHNLIRVRGINDYAVRAVRNINFTDALVSVLALQTALLAAYSEGVDFTWLTALVGTAICISSAFTGVYMLVNGFKKCRRQKLNVTAEASAISEETISDCISEQD